MKKNIRKYKLEIVTTIILLIITITVLGISKFLNIQGLDKLNTLSELIFSSLIGLVTIWISGYFILIQLYKNTYPMEIIEKNFLKKVKMILIYSILNILIGVLTLSLFNNVLTTLQFGQFLRENKYIPSSNSFSHSQLSHLQSSHLHS